MVGDRSVGLGWVGGQVSGVGRGTGQWGGVGDRSLG